MAAIGVGQVRDLSVFFHEGTVVGSIPLSFTLGLLVVSGNLQLLQLHCSSEDGLGPCGCISQIRWSENLSSFHVQHELQAW